MRSSLLCPRFHLCSLLHWALLLFMKLPYRRLYSFTMTLSIMPLSPYSPTLSSLSCISYPLCMLCCRTTWGKPSRESSWTPSDSPPLTVLFSCSTMPMSSRTCTLVSCMWERTPIHHSFCCLGWSWLVPTCGQHTVAILLDAQTHLHCPLHHAVLLEEDPRDTNPAVVLPSPHQANITGITSPISLCLLSSY